MHIGRALKYIAFTRGYKQNELAIKIGMKAPNISRAMSEKSNPQFQNLDMMLSELGYQIALVPSGANLPDGCIVIDNGEKK